jgi:MFS family permease
VSNVTEQDGEATAKARHMPIFALFTANTISFIGDALMLIAIPWFVLQTTGSVAKTGIAAFFETLPIFISAFLGGALVDRLGYKRMSVVSDITSGISVALIPLLYHTTGLAFWQLLILVFLAGFFQAPGSTARTSLVPDLAPLARMPLERANAASDGIRRVSNFIGFPLAGVLIALLGTSNLLWLDAISFTASAALVGLVVPRHSAGHSPEAEKGSYLSDILAGLRFIRRSQLMLAIVITIMITNLLDEAFFAVALPAYVKHFFGSAVILGVLSSCVGGAAFAGTIIFGAIGHRLPRRPTFSLAYITLSLRFFVFALVPFLPALILANIISGLGAGPLNPIMYTVEQELVPREMRARVAGTMTAGGYVGMPLGTLLCGYLVQWAGIMPGMFVIGICYLLTTTSLLVNPGLKAMARRPEGLAR